MASSTWGSNSQPKRTHAPWPFFADDAFANSDPERQAGVYRMLQQATADQVVELDATAGR